MCAVKGKRGDLHDRTKKAAGEAGMSVEDQEAAFAESGLKADNPPPETPKPVRDGQLMASYVLPHYRIDKEGEQVVEMEFSFPLTPDHKGMLPDGVETAWNFVARKNYPLVSISEIPEQTITIRKAPDMGEEYMLHLASALLVKARVKKTQQKGKGHVKTVILFSFRVLAEIRSEICKFADNKFGSEVWLEMAATQGELALGEK
jgi:hypothetical protein